MGSIIRIKEGGLPRAFDAAKLRTNLQGGGNCLWIPKDSVPVASKFITENGTYLAAAEGLHGFSSLNVSSQPDYVVGNKGGKTYYVHKGGTAGNDLIYEELPTEIQVTTPPEKTTYTIDEPYDYSGMVVKAFKEDSSIWENEKYINGVIPFDELILPENASDSGITPFYVVPDKSANHVEGDFFFTRHVVISYTAYKGNTGREHRYIKEYWSTGDVYISAFINDALYSCGFLVVWCRPPREKGTNDHAYYKISDTTARTGTTEVTEGEVELNNRTSSKYEGDIEKSVRYRSSWSAYNSMDDISDITTYNVNSVKSEYFFDTFYPHSGGEGVALDMMYGACRVPVKWERYMDGKVLETGFSAVIQRILDDNTQEVTP